MTITPSEQQTAAIRAIAEWFRNGSKPYFYLAGFAGSGKTSLAELAVAECGVDVESGKVVYIEDDVLYAAYTGKAAMVMTRKGMDASTVHSLIYKLVETKKGDLVFELDRGSILASARLLVLDECSMISDDLALDLLSFKVKILVLGDPGQLEPVSGSGYFTKGEPDFFLSEIHRQALENSIIRLSIDVRNNRPIPMGDHGGLIKMKFNDLTDMDMMAADQVLTGTNKTRWGLNQLMMRADGFEVGYPMLPGVKVMCLRNDRRHGLFNGMIGRTTQVVDASMINQRERYFVQGVQVDEGIGQVMQFGPSRIHMGAFQDNWDPRSEEQLESDQMLLKDLYSEAKDDPEKAQYLFDLGYAITVHKSQGSQWDTVILIDDGFLNWKRESRTRWLYTALTRAVDTFVWCV
jgi:exodeoxyribonuclease V